MNKSTLSGKAPKRNLLVEIIAALLLIFLTHSVMSISVYPGFPSLKNCLAFYTRNTSSIALLIILAEAIIAALLFIPRTRVVGLITVLIAALFAGYFQFRTPHYPHDFGGIINKLTRTQQYMFYGLLCFLSLAGLVLSAYKRKPKAERNPDQVVFT